MLPAVTLISLMASWSAPAPVPPGETVIRAAYAMYGGKWYHDALWVQRTVLYDEERLETWYVAVQPPTSIRIDVAPPVTGRALIYRNDSTYEIGRGAVRAAGVGSQPLYILLNALHSLPPARTIALLRKYNFDLSKSYSRSWDGAPVVVVGALPGDTASNQFWLEKKRMVLVRMFAKNGADPSRPLEARVTGYRRAGAGWLENRVLLFLGGKLSIEENYTNVAIDKPVDAFLFEPSPYRLPAWTRGAKDLYGGLSNPLFGGGPH
jgi:hypothetical protein